MNYLPSKDRVLLTRIQETSEALIEIPDQYQQVSCKGEVVSVGNNFKDQFKPGDIVFFGQYNNEDIKLDGVDYQIVWGDDIRLRVGKERKEYVRATV